MSVPSTFKRTPLTAADYVSADGSCAEAAAAEGGSEPKVAGAVALQMSECAVVRVLGAPEKVDIGANERGERLSKLLYSRGARPGLYSFTAGQLTEIERVAEPPPPKPQKPAAKPRRAAHLKSRRDRLEGGARLQPFLFGTRQRSGSICARLGDACGFLRVLREQPAGERGFQPFDLALCLVMAFSAVVIL